jgi:hypothetical protein
MGTRGCISLLTMKPAVNLRSQGLKVNSGAWDEQGGGGGLYLYVGDAAGGHIHRASQLSVIILE